MSNKKIKELEVLTGLTASDAFVVVNSGITKQVTFATITSGVTSSQSVTGFTYDNSNTFTITNGDNTPFSAYMGVISGVTTTGDITPDLDGDVNLGTPLKRFREVNTISGESSYWKSNIISATTINLGLDTENNIRILNAETSVLKNDSLNGGIY
jgi:hypothetical protein